LQNAEVYIYEQWYEQDMTLINTELVFAGKVDGKPGLTEEYASITVSGHINPWTQRFPRRRITKKNYPFIPDRGTQFTWGGEIIEIQ